MVEYALLVALIAAVAVVAVTLVGTNLSTTINNVAGTL
jgi:Flp pilus assembly pilin Flp